MKEIQNAENYIKDEIYKAMGNLYHGIVKVNLFSEDNNALILCSSEPSENGKEYPWDMYLKRYVEKYLVPSERTRAISLFSTKPLKEYFSQGKKFISSDLASYVIGKNKKHVIMTAFQLDDGTETESAYVIVRNTGGDYLLKSIVNQYVYDTCDYFIYLDAKNNSYTMFSGKAGTSLPPEICMDYEQALIDYAETFVIEEDREMVIREMHLAKVLEGIEKNGVHSFTCGVMDSERGYTRKRLDYRYHDKENQMILLSRTDITAIYLEEEKKRIELEKALSRAQKDPLTKLLNFQATLDKITELLSQKEESYALYFIDLDNFKSINDTYGHPTGDNVLRYIANSLLTIKEKDDIVGRVGGDEFVFFTKATGNQVTLIAQRICYAISAVKIDTKVERRVTGSVGIALAPEDGMDYYTLVKKADNGVYKAKKSGKNKYSF